MRRGIAVAVFATWATWTTWAAGSPAHADKTTDAVVKVVEYVACRGGLLEPMELQDPRMTMTDKVDAAPGSAENARGGWGEFAGATPGTPVLAIAADGKAAWVAMELSFGHICGMEQCMHDPPDAIAHATALLEPGKASWQPVVWDFARMLNAKQLANARRTPPAAIVRHIDPGAEEVAKLFEATLVDPAALARTVSDRKDVVLYGSDRPERYVGGAAVRAQLLKWKLGFKVRDGVFAGLTTSKTVAWLVANTDAARPDDKTTTAYRLLAVYEKTGNAWKIVQLSFSIPDESE